MKEQTTAVKQKEKRFLKRRQKRMIFSALILVLPVLQFCIFYIYTHLNMFALAFQRYNYAQGKLGYDIDFVWFDNFKTAVQTLLNNTYMIKNSLIMFACGLIIGLTLQLFFSYYIYKKFWGAGIFKVFLFMPHIISSVVIALLFKYFTEDVYSNVLSQITGTKVEGLFSNIDTRFATLVFYNLWVGLGVKILMFSNAMGNINSSIVESAALDGVTNIKEFWYITFPMIFPTFTTFIITGLSGIFTNQMELYTFFQYDAGEMATFGYYIYTQTLVSDVIPMKNGYLSYSEISALGLLLTCVLVPTTLIVKRLLEKYGPSTD